MDIIIIVLITLIFASIIMNVINNKKFSLVSFIMFLFIGLFYLIKGLFNEWYMKYIGKYSFIDIIVLIYCTITFIISIFEYITFYKKNNETINNQEQNDDNKNIKNTVEDINSLVVYLEMIEEPLACLVDNQYIINNKMKKLLNNDSYYVDKKTLYSYIHSTDKNNFFNCESSCFFRMKVNGEYLWFEGLFVIIKDIKYCLIKKHDEKINNKFKIKSFKELNNILREYDNKNKQYYLIFFKMINLNDIISFYGKDFMNIVVSKHLSNISDTPYITDANLFYISQNEYVILLDNLVEYNILLSDLESNMSLLIKNDISISNNKIGIIGRVGTIDSNKVKDRSYNNVINCGLEMLKLACQDDYSLEYAIFDEIDENIDYNFRDLNIDLDINLEEYKKRIL